MSVLEKIGFRPEGRCSSGPPRSILKKMMGASVLVSFAGGAHALDDVLAQYRQVLDTCLAQAIDHEARIDCIGRMSAICMDSEEGGHSTLGMSTCNHAEAQAWDHYLNVEYKATMSWAKTADSEEKVHFPEFANRADALRSAQRAWIAFRDAECGLSYARNAAVPFRRRSIVTYVRPHEHVTPR